VSLEEFKDFATPPVTDILARARKAFRTVFKNLSFDAMFLSFVELQQAKNNWTHGSQQQRMDAEVFTAFLHWTVKSYNEQNAVHEDEHYIDEFTDLEVQELIKTFDGDLDGTIAITELRAFANPPNEGQLDSIVRRMRSLFEKVSLSSLSQAYYDSQKAENLPDRPSRDGDDLARRKSVSMRKSGLQKSYTLEVGHKLKMKPGVMQEFLNYCIETHNAKVGPQHFLDAFTAEDVQVICDGMEPAPDGAYMIDDLEAFWEAN